MITLGENNFFSKDTEHLAVAFLFFLFLPALAWIEI